MQKIIGLLWLGLNTLSLYATAEPSNTTVTVLQNKRALTDAIVRVIPLQKNSAQKETIGFTDSEGNYAYMFIAPVIIQISHLAYTTITDTVYQLQNKTYHITQAIQNMNDVVVTGQYAPNSVQKSVYEVKVISSETIRTKGATNLREALQNELNIDLGQDQIFGSNLSINGISGEGVKIMVDGVPLIGRLDGKLDLSQININNVERIEVVEGPLSVMYGTDALGGVLNIITKNFQTDKVNLNLKGYYETVGQYNVELNGGFTFGKNQFFVSGGRNFFAGFSSSDSLLRAKEWKPKEQYFADAKYIYTGNRFRVSVSGSFFREVMLNRSEPKQTLLYTPTDTTWTYTADDGHYLTYRPRASASFMYHFKDNQQLDALLAYSGFIRFSNMYAKNLVSGVEQLVADPAVHDTTRYHQVISRATYAMPAWKNRINFQFGSEVNQEYTEQTRILDGHQQSGDYAAFGSARITLVENLNIQPAIRFAYNTRFQTPLIPSLNLHYNYHDKFVLRASYGRGYRAPSLKELFLTFFDSNHSLKGNSNLKPEDGHCVNASLIYSPTVHQTHHFTFGVSGFFNLIQNKINWKIIPSNGIVVDTYQYFNIKKYETYGGEITANYRWQRFSFRASSMITRYELSNTNSGSDKIKLLSPDASAGVSYIIPKAEIGVNIFYKYNGIKPLFSVNSSVQAGTRSAYHSLDVSLTRNFWKDRIQLTVGGKNLAGVKNVITSGVTAIGHNFSGDAVNIGWGRTFFTSLVLHFSK
jgi:outer membrane receptor for ferrienterochelin and colicins